jgi:hypothetical protein
VFPPPRLPAIRYLVLRALVRCRRAARRAAGGATACCALAWSFSYAITYTAFGLLFAGVALVLTTVFAACCWLVSGE